MSYAANCAYATPCRKCIHPQCANYGKKIMLYILDKTIITGGNNTLNEQVLLPNVWQTIHNLRSQGHEFAIAANQGGIEMGFVTERQVVALMQDAARKIGGVSAWRYCPHYRKPCDCRKPKPGMIISIAQELGYNMREVAYIGDQEIDKQAAQAAGCTFFTAKEFFQWT